MKDKYYYEVLGFDREGNKIRKEYYCKNTIEARLNYAQDFKENKIIYCIKKML